MKYYVILPNLYLVRIYFISSQFAMIKIEKMPQLCAQIYGIYFPCFTYSSKNPFINVFLEIKSSFI